MTDEEIRFAADAIRDADSVVAMSGAGVSTASGIPDFRSEDGIWQEYDPMDFHISRFEADPEGFWTERAEMVEDLFGDEFQPNPAHEALATLQQEGHLDGLITQNIDGLHQEAGSDEVIEIHGNGQRVACYDCSRTFEAEVVFDRVRAGAVPPRCPNCEGLLKPDVVLFGEQLPEYPLFRAQSLAERADLFLVVGSSLTVEPAASFPRTAAEAGATLCIVNLDRTGLSDRAEYDFRADVTDVLPAIRDAVQEGT
ncbi:SIR2 family NAD-dependent protein deacylase [Haloglomus litoreum]|uniref:SIR2 family NAD-dependent protein deacylase n=1 Tax=Haloglomus litoreum TaxID=3034026 RepID=UPI0023E7D504|nr:NAD-dependent deacylase [Haloglomus sp. DT116]